jgi:peptidoglycan/xylan/chitin deacetylase (PgdA/CDA1 family)
MALVVGACSSTNPSPSTSTPSGASLAPGQTPSGTPSGTASTPTGTPSPGESGEPQATPTVGPDETPGPEVSPTPKPPKPLADYPTHGKRTQKVIALTFDADMYPFMYPTKDSYHEYDTRTLKLLKDNDVHATIFLNGLYVKAYPDIVKDLAKQPGIELANHTWDHAAWPGCSDPAAPALDNKKTEITKTEKIVKDEIGTDMFWFRFPGGCYGGGSDLELVKDLGSWPVGWDCYFGDSLGWSGDQQFSNVKATCGKGSIVITHLNNTKYHPGVYDALKQLIPWWKENGWTIVNVGELLGRETPPAE